MKKNNSFVFICLLVIQTFTGFQGYSQLMLSLNATNVSCSGLSNGAIDLTVSGGITPYAYLWSNGATTHNITGVVAGIYSVTVTDSTVPAFSEVGSANISQPVPISISQFITAPTFALPNGEIDILTFGCTPPCFLEYIWSNGATTSILTGLPAGP